MAVNIPNWFDMNVYLTNKLAQVGSGYTMDSLVKALNAAGFVGQEGYYNHFLKYGHAEDVSPNAGFNASQYYIFKAASYYDKAASAVTDAEAATIKSLINAAGMDAWTHYEKYGTVEQISASNSFDTAAYLQAKAAALNASQSSVVWTAATVATAIQNAGMSAYEHYMNYKGAGAGEVASTAVYAVDASKQAGNPGQTFALTTGADTVVGTAGNDTINGTILNSFSSFDNIDGGAGVDTMNILTDQSALPSGVTVKNVENITVNTTSSTGYAFDGSAFTGLSAVNLTASNQTTGAVSVNGTAGVTVTAQNQTTGTITVGATTAPTGTVTISSTGSAASGAAVGAITVNGGSTVSITQSTSNSTAPGVGVNGTATGSAITVNGTADTTSVVVKQSAPIAAVTGVAAVTESAAITVAAGGLTAGQSVTIGGLTYTSTAATNQAQLEAAFANLAAGATTGGGTGTGSYSGTLTGWSTGAAAGHVITATSITANSNVADLTFTDANSALTSVVETQGAAFVQGVVGVADGTVTITDVNASSSTAAGKISAVSLQNFGVATVNSGALNTVTLAGAGTSFTQTNGALTTATVTTEALNLNGVTTTGAVTLGAVPKTVNIVSSNAANSLQTLSAAGATAVNISGDKALTLTNHTFDSAAVITSTSTGAVTISDALAVGQQYTGGAGVDTITVGATTKVITTGAGDDFVNLTAPALGTGGSIDAGAGSADVLSMSAANAVTASSGTTFASAVKGFEILQVAINSAANPTVDLANLNNGSNNSIHTVEFTATNSDSITLANLTSGDTVQFDAAQSAGKIVTASVAGALAGTSDVLNIKVTSLSGVDVKGVDATNVETVNFLTNDKVNDSNASASTTHLQHSAALTDAAAKTITVAGDAGLNLSFAGTALTTFDASAVTDGTVTYTTGALANAAVIKGGAYANVIDFTAATKAVTYTGGAGADTLNFSAANSQANVINLGDGTNTITGGSNLSGNNTITGGSGVDTIVVGNGNNTITAGAGNDLITVGSGSNSVSMGAGNDKLTIGAVNQSSAIFTTVTDLAAGDMIDNGALTAFANATGKLGAALTSGVNDYQTFLNAAASKGVGIVSWFQFGGDTYLVEDNTAAATFTGNSDLVVKITGVVDLSNSTLVNGGHTITIA